MLAIGRLREQTFSRPELVAVWKKAVESAQDAELPAMSLDGALRSAYDAGHLACLALLASHGLRPGGGPGHHEMAFAGAAAVGGIPFADLVPDSEEVRLLRTGSMYDPGLADDSDLHCTLGWMRRTLPSIRATLVELDPVLATLLEPYP